MTTFAGFLSAVAAKEGSVSFVFVSKLEAGEMLWVPAGYLICIHGITDENDGMPACTVMATPVLSKTLLSEVPHDVVKMCTAMITTFLKERETERCKVLGSFVKTLNVFLQSLST